MCKQRVPGLSSGRRGGGGGGGEEGSWIALGHCTKMPSCVPYFLMRIWKYRLLDSLSYMYLHRLAILHWCWQQPTRWRWGNTGVWYSTLLRGEGLTALHSRWVGTLPCMYKRGCVCDWVTERLTLCSVCLTKPHPILLTIFADRSDFAIQVGDVKHFRACCNVT